MTSEMALEPLASPEPPPVQNIGATAKHVLSPLRNPVDALDACASPDSEYSLSPQPRKMPDTEEEERDNYTPPQMTPASYLVFDCLKLKSGPMHLRSMPASDRPTPLQTTAKVCPVPM